MLLVAHHADAVAELVDGTLECPTPACEGHLRPWGHARLRRVRVALDRIESLRPRRARCRSCRRSHVLSEMVTYPRRLDTVETVGRALVLAADGLGHRRVAEQLDRPESTVRDWLRRARTNSEAVRADATVAYIRIDTSSVGIAPADSPLGDMVSALGTATAAWVRRFGPVASPWRLSALLTRAGVLALQPQPRWHGVV
jgi:Homeodomain-like domain